MLADRNDCLMALAKAHKDPEAYKLVEGIINEYFTVMKHLKETSLYDVLEYEKRLMNGLLEPVRIISYDNERLKKEVNRLRAKLGKIPKYKEDENEIR